MQFTLRDATAEDAEAMVLLLADLGKHTGMDAVRTRLGALLEEGGSAVLAVATDGTPLGLMTMSTHVTLHNAGPVAYITALVTSAAARRSGIGRGLVAHAVEWARGKGCSRISVSSNQFRTEAHAFYESCGLPCSGKRFSAAIEELA